MIHRSYLILFFLSLFLLSLWYTHLILDRSDVAFRTPINCCRKCVIGDFRMIQFVGVGGAGIVAVPQHYAHKLLVCLKQRSISNTLKMPKLLSIYEFISCYNSSIQLHFFHGKLGSRGKRATIESRYPTYDTCWVCQCFHIQANSDMSYSMFTMYVGDRFA